MKVAVCLIVRNEARDIAEWMAFHAAAGFDAQLIFDHGSEDGTAETIRRAGRRHDIRYHDWRPRSGNAQTAAYLYAAQTASHEFDWIAFIDSDEFFVVESGEAAGPFLSRYEGWSGLAVPWAIYGSSGHEAAPDGLVTEAFTHRAAPDFFPNQHVKSVVRPGTVRGAPNPHCFDLAPGERGTYCTPDGASAAWLPAPEHGGVLAGVLAAPPSYGICRINHYFTRSRAHWEAKMRRGYEHDGAIRRDDEFARYDRNEVADPIAAGRAAELRAIIASW